jgi:hypothetical protein
VAQGLALALLMPQQQGALAVEPQQENRRCRHLGLEDQGRLLGELLRRRQKQAIEAHLQLFDGRSGEAVALHRIDQLGHQGLEAIAAALKEPEEELVAGDHRGPELALLWFVSTSLIGGPCSTQRSTALSVAIAESASAGSNRSTGGVSSSG